MFITTKKLLKIILFVLVITLVPLYFLGGFSRQYYESNFQFLFNRFGIILIAIIYIFLHSILLNKNDVLRKTTKLLPYSIFIFLLIFWTFLALSNILFPPAGSSTMAYEFVYFFAIIPAIIYGLIYGFFVYFITHNNSGKIKTTLPLKDTLKKRILNLPLALKIAFIIILLSSFYLYSRSTTLYFACPKNEIINCSDPKIRNKYCYERYFVWALGSEKKAGNCPDLIIKK